MRKRTSPVLLRPSLPCARQRRWPTIFMPVSIIARSSPFILAHLGSCASLGIRQRALKSKGYASPASLPGFCGVGSISASSQEQSANSASWVTGSSKCSFPATLSRQLSSMIIVGSVDDTSRWHLYRRAANRDDDAFLLDTNDHYRTLS